MRQLSATEAARHFSDVLDSVESERESFLVVRRGRIVATIAPAIAGSGGALKRALRENHPDAGWGTELRELRNAVGPSGDPWHD
jgi:antitoxin (DNA-binding transcriptional repressor) of toxin-antitoxin stability system